MPFTPPSIPWSSLQQAMEAQARINKMMPAIEAAMRNSEVIQAGAKQLEEYHAMQPYIEEAMQAQEAFNKSKEERVIELLKGLSPEQIMAVISAINK